MKQSRIGRGRSSRSRCSYSDRRRSRVGQCNSTATGDQAGHSLPAVARRMRPRATRRSRRRRSRRCPRRRRPPSTRDRRASAPGRPPRRSGAGRRSNRQRGRLRGAQHRRRPLKALHRQPRLRFNPQSRFGPRLTVHLVSLHRERATPRAVGLHRHDRRLLRQRAHGVVLGLDADRAAQPPALKDSPRAPARWPSGSAISTTHSGATAPSAT